MNPKLQSCLDDALAALKRELGKNLCSYCLYGSAGRGNEIEGGPDLYLLNVLTQSSSAAHQAVAGHLSWSVLGFNWFYFLILIPKD